MQYINRKLVLTYIQQNYTLIKYANTIKHESREIDIKYLIKLTCVIFGPTYAYSKLKIYVRTMKENNSCILHTNELIFLNWNEDLLCV